jgi:cysteine synthase A
MIIDSILDAVGNVPLVRLSRMSSGNVFAKAEFLNPGGSIKDRVAKYILQKAITDGELKPGMTIIEATSGNTGIGLCLVGVRSGFRVICVMPDSVSGERKRIIEALGGEAILTPAEQNLTGCLDRIQEIIQSDPGSFFWVNQFQNPNNPAIHYQQTGPEIWQDANGEVDVFIAGIGSGGTLQGVGKYLKEQNPRVKIVAVEPRNSTSLLSREPGFHQIQGIGDGFIPAVVDVNLIDMVVTISDEEAISTTRRLACEEGLLVGTSSGANITAALHLDNGRNKIVTVLPDRAERYFSTALL